MDCEAIGINGYDLDVVSTTQAVILWRCYIVRGPADAVGDELPIGPPRGWGI